MNNMKIEWNNYVDHIFCITYLPSGRLHKFKNVLTDINVNIKDNNFFTFMYDYDHFLFKSYYDEIVKKSLNFYNNNVYYSGNRLNFENFEYTFYVAYNSYRALKIAQYFNYDRIIIFEDDLIFLKDINYIINALNFVNEQNDFDLCLCQTTFCHCFHGIRKYLQNVADDLGNDFFMKTSEPTGVFGGGFIILTKNGIDKIIKFYEENDILVCLDSLENFKNTKIKLTTLFALKPLCIQECMLNWTNEQIEYYNKNMIIDEYI